MFLITQRNTEFRQSQARPLNRIDQVFNQQLFPRLTWVDGWITDQLCQFFWVGDLNHILYPIIATDHVQNKEIIQDELQIKETYEKAFLCPVDTKFVPELDRFGCIFRHGVCSTSCCSCWIWSLLCFFSYPDVLYFWNIKTHLSW